MIPSPPERLRQLSLLCSLSLTLPRRSGRPLLLRFLNLLQDCCFQRLRLGNTSPAPNDLPIGGNQELLEIPLDALQPHKSRHHLLHPCPHGRRIVAVDIQLAQHGKGDAVVDLAEGLDLVVRAGVLAAKLVAGEAKNGEVFGMLGLDGLVEVLEAFKLRSEAAFGGGVDDEDDFAFEGGEVEGFALLCRGIGSARPCHCFSRGWERESQRQNILSAGLKS